MKRMIRSPKHLITAAAFDHSERLLVKPIEELLSLKQRLDAATDKKLEIERQKLCKKYGVVMEEILANGVSVLFERPLLKPKKHVMATSKVTKTVTKRAVNDISLLESIANALKDAGKPMSIGEIMTKVKRQGYSSNSSNFRSIVNQTLIKHRQLFRSTGRGVYALKK